MLKEVRDTNGDLTLVNTTFMTNMKDMFRNANSFNQDISSWDVSKVKNMHSTFAGADEFNQDISNWKVPKVNSCECFSTTKYRQTIEKQKLPSFKCKTNCPNEQARK